MIKEIKVSDEYDLIKWKLDTNRFASKYPNEYKEYTENVYLTLYEDTTGINPKELEKGSDWAVKEYVTMIIEKERGIDLPESNMKAWELSEEIPSIEISLKNGKRQTISNLSLFKINGDDVDAFNFFCEHNFLYCIIFRAIGQAGTLGIWDTKDQKWCFAYSDEGFCVEEVKYDKTKDEFFGSFSYDHPMSYVGGSGFFQITKDRELKTVSYKYTDSEGNEIVGTDNFFES
jgi:hypothetical protein